MAQLDLCRAATIFWRDLCGWCGGADDDSEYEWRVGVLFEWDEAEEACREG
jgi:hypothetical protein